jgi:hypothetical protein
MVDTKERQGWDEGNLVVIIYIRLDRLLLRSKFRLSYCWIRVRACMCSADETSASGVQLRV